MSRLLLSIVVLECLKFTSAKMTKGMLSDNDRAKEKYINDHLSMVDRLTKYGYPSEVHYITTRDGYILTTYRIPYGRLCGPERTRKRPVILMHGIAQSSNDFIVASADNGLGYILADDCFDVWLPNVRGTFESINHTSLDTKSREYWHFDWHEMGQFDAPAIVNYILALTEEEQLHWVALSQGTTVFFVYASLYPEEAGRKVKSMHAMAPVAFMDSSDPIFNYLAPRQPFVKAFLDILGVKQFLPKSKILGDFFAAVCLNEENRVGETCTYTLYILFGYDSREFNTSLFSIFLANDPAGSSIRQWYHYGSCLEAGRFMQFDHGVIENKERYGSVEPPDYRLDLIETKMYLYYSDTDLVASKPSIMKLHDATKNTSKLIKVAKTFNHLDYIYGRDVRKLVYDGLIEQLNEDEKELEEEEEQEGREEVGE